MGEVYRARDTRLERTVAVKILPDHLAIDAQFRQRLEREARVISSLEHPHICALYDVGDYNGTPFLVMQYLEGETLADRLARGLLPVPQALECAVQIPATGGKHRGTCLPSWSGYGHLMPYRRPFVRPRAAREPCLLLWEFWL